MHRVCSTGLGIAVWIALWPAYAAPTLPLPQFDISVSGSGGNLATVDRCEPYSASGSGALSYACQAGLSNGPFTGTAGASAGPGAAGANAGAVVASDLENAYGVTMSADAQATDFVAIYGVPGAAGHLFGNFVVHGNLDASAAAAGSGNSAAQAGYSVQTGFAGVNGALQGDLFRASSGLESGSMTSGGGIPVDALLSFGPDGWAVVQVSMYLQVSASASAFAAAAANGGASFGSTVFWGGIDAIIVDGVPLADYEIVSASGVDYRLPTAPVPEPAPAWLASLGLLALFARRRLRGRS